MELVTHDNKGKAGEKITVSDRLFGAKTNADLVYQVATSLMSNSRQILAHTKTRSEVRGGGKKPWAQKGTGRARHGSIRSPSWVGGGVAHGPTKDVNFKKKVNRSQARAALAAVLSARVRDGHLAVVDDLGLTTGKTKEAAAVLAALAAKTFKDYRGRLPAGRQDRVLVVLAGTPDEVPLRRATANLPNIVAVRAQDLNTLTVLAFPYVIATRPALDAMEKTFSGKKVENRK
jgi:large subunit ribosomal protein L4